MHDRNSADDGRPDAIKIDDESPERSTERVANPGRRAVLLGGAAAITVGSVAASGMIGGRMISAPPYRGPKTEYFNGHVFTNLSGSKQRGLGDVVKWQINKKQGPWGPRASRPPGPKPPERVGRGEVRVTFVGHATLLIQMDEQNILTDPIWSERCSPFPWAGPRRFRPPGIRFNDLPPIDAVLLSHNHYDHFDLPTLKNLDLRDRPKIYTALGNTALLEKHRVKTSQDMAWWDEVEIAKGLSLACVPAEHWSGRGTADRGATLWCGFVLTGKDGPVFFGGDSGYGAHFKTIGEKYGSPRIAFMPIGAYLPRWFMGPVHMSPEDAVIAHKDLGAAKSIGIHHSTFMLADDGQDEALEDLKLAREKHDLAEEKFAIMDEGAGVDVA